ncbi:MAG: YceI family protein [bacterium]
MLGLALVLLAGTGVALAVTLVGGGAQTDQTAPAPSAPAQVGGAAAPAGTQRFALAPGQSSVTYRVDETLFNEGNRLATAVGTTTEVRGDIFVHRTQPARSRIGTITVDISQFKSDSTRRDNAIRGRWLESEKYPIAEFTSTEIKGLPASYVDGREIPVQITGNLKIRNITRPTTWQATIKLAGDQLTVTGKTEIKMTDFGFDPPAIVFLRTVNEARLEFRFVAAARSD